MRLAALLTALALTSATSQVKAQWQLQDAHTTADLRGIDYVGNGVAWVSGSDGTVLRTEDMGAHWQLCTIPPNAGHLDFRGIQAFDNNIAIVMSSGKGDLSRLYKTTDGCQTWKLLFTNPDKDGFWDALLYDADFDELWILGDPVSGSFRLFSEFNTGKSFHSPAASKGGDDLRCHAGEAVFAASNSALIRGGEFGSIGFVTGGSRSEFISETHGLDVKQGPVEGFSRSVIPFPRSESAGAFSVATSKPKKPAAIMVAVGGDYKFPLRSEATAAFSNDWGATWAISTTPPHGYRSAVAYEPKSNTWITVGPNGTDISTDDGRNWRALLPSPGEAPDTAQHWNALSLPFVVGPHGRIGLLRTNAPPFTSTQGK